MTDMTCPFNFKTETINKKKLIIFRSEKKLYIWYIYFFFIYIQKKFGKNVQESTRGSEVLSLVERYLCQCTRFRRATRIVFSLFRVKFKRYVLLTTYYSFFPSEKKIQNLLTSKIRGALFYFFLK